jgi:DNA-binding winged helix-turn-helix (wHTH) protein
MLRDLARFGGAEVKLTPIERGLLYMLVANSGRVLARDEILDALWGAEHAAESNVVDQHVRNLRAKLQEISQKRLVIATVPGKGYRFLFGDTVESRASSTSEGPRLQYCRDVAGLPEFDFDRVQELDERLALGDLVGIAA